MEYFDNRNFIITLYSVNTSTILKGDIIMQKKSSKTLKKDKFYIEDYTEEDKKKEKESANKRK